MDREFIISEIKRLAELNGNKPPGKILFLKETGIKESDWYGKYWNKWSDAIGEAGLRPNKMQQPLNKEFLLQKIADLIREIGKYPVKGDLLMKSRSDSEFPSHNTFQRFGEKPECQSALKIDPPSASNFDPPQRVNWGRCFLS